MRQLRGRCVTTQHSDPVIEGDGARFENVASIREGNDNLWGGRQYQRAAATQRGFGSSF
jgi:hypothetical protein